MFVEKINRIIQSYERSMSSLMLTVCITFIVFVSFVLFYTMYDKTKKRLVVGNLVRLFTLQEGLDKLVVEMNKAISLSGLTVLALTFFPRYKNIRKMLLFSAMIQLWLHAGYSVFRYYGSKKIPVVSAFFKMRAGDSIKKLSVIFGIIAQVVLSLGYLSYIPYSRLAFFGLAFSNLHFYTMEIDHKYILRVRPYAYIVFPLSLLGALYGTKYLWRY